MKNVMKPIVVGRKFIVSQTRTEFHSFQSLDNIRFTANFLFGYFYFNPARQLFTRTKTVIK